MTGENKAEKRRGQGESDANREQTVQIIGTMVGSPQWISNLHSSLMPPGNKKSPTRPSESDDEA